MLIIDLHIHSNNSDGKLSVKELAVLIKEKGLKYCALTDHDCVDGINELKGCLRGSNIAVIPGVELTALYKENEIHILAYDFDVNEVAKILMERNLLVREQRVNEMQKAIKLFKQEGYKISDDLVLVEKKPVGYILAMDICKQQYNHDFFLKKHGRVLTLDDIYFEYQAPGKVCAVDRSGVSVEWLLNKLKDKVSDLIIAHPFLKVSIVNQLLSKNDIISLLNMGLSGVEVFHDKTSKQRIQWLKKIVKEKKLHYTGGSDFHANKNNTEIGMYGLDLEIPSFKIKNFKS